MSLFLLHCASPSQVPASDPAPSRTAHRPSPKTKTQNEKPTTSADSPRARQIHARVEVSSVVTAGPRTPAEIRSLLQTKSAAMARCFKSTVGDSVAIELSFTMSPTHEIPQVTYFSDVSPAFAACLSGSLGAKGAAVAVPGEPTSVYAAVLFHSDRDGGFKGTVPSPNLEEDMALYCNGYRLSGARELPIRKRSEHVEKWKKETIRHPEVHHMTWRVWAADVSNKKEALRREIYATGVKSCPDFDETVP